MSHTWGPVTNNYRLGIEVSQSPATVGSGTTHVTLTVNVYGQSVEWGHNWTNTLRFGGAWSGSKSVSFYSGFGATVTKTLHTAQITVPVAFAKTTARTFTASIDGYGAASVTHTHTVGARPYVKPRPPRNLTAKWSGNNKSRITWQGDYDGATGAQPWNGVRVLRQVNDGAWQQLAALHWNATSYEDTTAPLNAVCQYAVASHNSSGDSPLTVAGVVKQRPTAPKNVAASKAGRDVTITWSGEYPNGLVTGFNVYDNGAKVGSVSAPLLSFVHTNATTDRTHTYTVAAVTELLESDRSLPSNTVQLLARPNTPLLVSPSAEYVSGIVNFGWKHNPADASEQTRAEVRYRRVGGGGWTTKAVSGREREHDAPLTVGLWEWQVRTWGEYKSGSEDGASPWSNLDSFTVVNYPSVSANVADVVPSSHLKLSWGYYQHQNSPQSAVSITLYEGATAVYEHTLQGAASSFEVPYPLKNGAAYAVAIRARSGHGLWSPPDRHEFTVQFPAPPLPIVSLSWDATVGATVVNVANPLPSGIEPAAVHNDIYRSADGGDTWERVALQVGVDTVVKDFQCPVSGELVYKIVAVSALPSSAEATANITPDSHGIYVSAGVGFSEVIRLTRNTQLNTSDSLEYQEAHFFAGRTRPVFFEGGARRSTLGVSALLLPDRAARPGEGAGVVRDVLRRFAGTPGVKLLRDTATGARVYGRITSLNVVNLVDGRASVQFSFMEGEAL